MLPVERETNNRYKEHTHVAAALIRCAASSWTLFNLLLASLRSPFAFLSLHAKFVVSFQHTDIPLPIEIHFLVPWGFVLLVYRVKTFFRLFSLISRNDYWGEPFRKEGWEG
jgi:hypothetical protein